MRENMKFTSYTKRDLLFNTIDIEVRSGGFVEKSNNFVHSFYGQPDFSLYFPVSGSRTLLFLDSTLTLLPGCFYLIPANVPFSCITEKDFTHCWIAFVSEKLQQIHEFKPYCKVEATPEYIAEFKDFISKIGDMPEPEIRLDSILKAKKLIIPFMLNISDSEAEERSADADDMTRVIRHIDSNLNKNLRIIQLAKLAGMNMIAFSSRFKKAFGLSPKKYICRARIEKSISLLENPELTVKEVAYMSGYRNEFLFSRLFKNHAGISPKEYRCKYLK